MSDSLRDADAAVHHTSCEIPRPVMAKAVLTDGEKRLHFGQILRRMMQIAGENVDGAADVLRVDRAQFSRWLPGKENPLVYRITECDEQNARAVKLRDAFLAAQAERNPNARWRWVIDIEQERKVG